MRCRREKLVVLVTPMTAYHLRQMAKQGTQKDVGRAVDKLVRDRMVLLRQAMETGRQGRGPGENRGRG